MKNQNQNPKEKTNIKNDAKPLFEDLKGHNHDSASYNKLMNERNNRIKKDK